MPTLDSVDAEGGKPPALDSIEVEGYKSIRSAGIGEGFKAHLLTLHP
jgi:hypothetical protein